MALHCMPTDSVIAGFYNGRPKRTKDLSVQLTSTLHVKHTKILADLARENKQ